MFETETESDCCQESDYADSDISDNEEDKQITSPSKAAFIVYWTSLIVLLKKCLHSTCLMRATITNLVFKASQLIVRLKCQEGHKTEWKSQPNCNHYSVGNTYLFSANTYRRLARFFVLAGIQWISKTSFYALQNCYLYGIVNRNYTEKSKAILGDIKQAKSIDLSEDGRCDSRGHNAKYLTYSFMDKSTNKFGAFSLTSVTEAGNSNKMEKEGFEKALKSLKDESIIPEQITTDRHVQIRKYLKEEEPSILITHQFDVWHFAKDIKKKLLVASKKSSCKILEKWIKSIGNHF